MSRYLVILVFIIALSTPVFAQKEQDSLEMTEIPDCEAIAQYSTQLIMYYYAIGDFDSIAITLNNWQTDCGLTEPILRTRILLSIRDSVFDETLYDSTVVDYVLNYLKRIESKSDQNLYTYYPGYFGYVPIASDYDYFTQNIADELLKRNFYSPVELFYSQLYANILTNPVHDFRIDTNLNNSDLKSYYNKEVNKYLAIPDFNLNFFTGIWIPYGNAATLGNHPLLGVQGGISYRKMTYNVSMAFKFLKSKNQYSILRDGVVESTDYFFGGYIGFDMERELLKKRNSEFSLLAGIGYDGFDSVNVNTEDDDTNNDTGHSVNSLNANFGLGYRLFYKYDRYIALQGKYNIVNYKNKGGTNLYGNCLTVTFLVGGLFNENKNTHLNELRYFD